MTTLQQLMTLSGRRVLITGANGYLGRVMTETLAELGADLILLDRPGTDFAPLENELAEKWKVKILKLTYDLEVQDDRNALIARVKSDGLGLDCLINNAAFVGSANLQGWVAPFEEQTIDTWRRAIEVNLTAAFHLSQAMAPELRASKGGNIINIASIYGEYGPDMGLYEGTAMGNPAAYAASKGGLLQLTRWLATTMAPHVRVNAISPGGVFRNQPAQFVERYVSKTPLRRMATEDDFRGAVAYLATNMSSYVTGQTMRVDGGWGVW
jgi:NAD(P)-dependent dehydrogenase (short-subunit alcohol dehydrogenase family)